MNQTCLIKNVSKHVGLILVIKQSHVFNTPHVFPICWVMMVLNVTGGAVCPQDFFPYRLLSSWKLWNSGPWNLPCVSFTHSLYKLHGCESAVAVLLQQRSLLLTCAHITGHKSAAVSPTCFPFPPAHTPSPLCQRACSSSSSWASHSGGSTLTGLRGCTCLYPLTAVTAND